MRGQWDQLVGSAHVAGQAGARSWEGGACALRGGQDLAGLLASDSGGPWPGGRSGAGRVDRLASGCVAPRGCQRQEVEASADRATEANLRRAAICRRYRSRERTKCGFWRHCGERSSGRREFDSSDETSVTLSPFSVGLGETTRRASDERSECARGEHAARQGLRRRPASSRSTRATTQV